jgi:hypothetical protein
MSNALRFENIDLASGISGARDGQGMKRGESHYVDGSGYGIGISGDTSDTDTDYYVVWNQWPTFTGSNANTNDTVSATALGTILGINRLDFRAKADHDSGTLDIAIIRKSNGKAVRVTVTGTTETHYTNLIADNAVIKEITSFDGLWTPERARLLTLGYI